MLAQLKSNAKVFNSQKLEHENCLQEKTIKMFSKCIPCGTKQLRQLLYPETRIEQFQENNTTFEEVKYVNFKK